MEPDFVLVAEPFPEELELLVLEYVLKNRLRNHEKRQGHVKDE